MIVWPASDGGDAGFRSRVETRVARILEDTRDTGLHWLPIVEESSANHQDGPAGGDDFPIREFPARWRQRYDQAVIVHASRTGARWDISAYPLAPWDDEPPWRRKQSVMHARLLSLQIAQVIRLAWAPSFRVTAIVRDRFRLSAPFLVGGDTAAGEQPSWPVDSVFRVLVTHGERGRRLYRRLPHAFAPSVSSTPTNDLTAPLVAIASDLHAIQRALAAGQPVLLAPARPTPGHIRIRAVDRASGRGLPNVEVYASTRGFSHDPAHLVAVTNAAGDPIDLLDESGSLWYVTLKTGTSVFEAPLMNPGGDRIVSIPITPGDESLVSDEIDFLVDDFNRAIGKYKRLRQRGDTLAAERRYADAHAAYVAARDVCPVADELSRLADDAYRRYHPMGTRHARDEKLVADFKTQIRRQIATCRGEIKDRLARLAATQKLSERVTQAEKTEKRALEARSRCQIDQALQLYDDAIAQLPPKVEYRHQLERRRAELAEAWRIRGGEKQRRAREYVYAELESLGPENAGAQLPLLRKHISCLINHRDRYTLRKSAVPIRKLFDQVVAQAGSPEVAENQERLEELSDIAGELSSLLDRIHDALSEQ